MTRMAEGGAAELPGSFELLSAARAPRSATETRNNTNLRTQNGRFLAMSRRGTTPPPRLVLSVALTVDRGDDFRASPTPEGVSPLTWTLERVQYATPSPKRGRRARTGLKPKRGPPSPAPSTSPSRLETGGGGASEAEVPIAITTTSPIESFPYKVLSRKSAKLQRSEPATRAERLPPEKSDIAEEVEVVPLPSAVPIQPQKLTEAPAALGMATHVQKESLPLEPLSAVLHRWRTRQTAQPPRRKITASKDAHHSSPP